MGSEESTTDKINGERIDNLNPEMPEDVRVYVKRHTTPKMGFRTRLYRTTKHPLTGKWQKKFLEERLNGFFEFDFGEPYIKAKYGGGKFNPITVWQTKEGEHGIENDTIDIEGPPKEVTKHEETHRSHDGDAPGANYNSQPGASVGFDVEKLAKYLPLVTGAIEAIKSIIPKPDVSSLIKLQESQLALIDKTGREATKMKQQSYADDMSKLDDMIDKVKKMQSDVIGEEDEDEEEENSNVWPDWIQPWVPKLEKYADKLLGSSVLSSGIRKLIIKNKTFQKCWDNPEKKAQAIKALKSNFGNEFANDLERLFQEQINDQGKE